MFEDDLNWLKGNHSFGFGGSMTKGMLWLESQTVVPEVRFGVVANDPAAGLFVPANFPGASTTQINNARNLYALLTGRVSQVIGNARLDENSNQ